MTEQQIGIMMASGLGMTAAYVLGYFRGSSKGVKRIKEQMRVTTKFFKKSQDLAEYSDRLNKSAQETMMKAEMINGEAQQLYRNATDWVDKISELERNLKAKEKRLANVVIDRNLH